MTSSRKSAPVKPDRTRLPVSQSCRRVRNARRLSPAADLRRPKRAKFATNLSRPAILQLPLVSTGTSPVDPAGSVNPAEKDLATVTTSQLYAMDAVISSDIAAGAAVGWPPSICPIASGPQLSPVVGPIDDDILTTSKLLELCRANKGKDPLLNPLVTKLMEGSDGRKGWLRLNEARKARTSDFDPTHVLFGWTKSVLLCW
jgi:hypothetical protein